VKVRKAVIPVAGLGTRMLPATKVVPKELVPVAGKPAIQWVVESAVASGIEEIILVTAAGKSAIEDHFDCAPQLERVLRERGKRELLDIVEATRKLAKVVSVRQPEPLGLGHAVLMARAAVGDEPFAVILPDELVHGDEPALAQCLRDTGDAECVIGLVRVPRSEVHRYGIVHARDIDARTVLIDDMVEKPTSEDAPSDLAITGPYVLTPDVFDDLEQIGLGVIGEIQLTDALRALAARRRMAGRLIEGERLDVGHALGFVQANVVKTLADPQLGPALREWLRSRA
jgi:UTP--glucose-1-phosphate uridylyltransferase